jgi:DNA-binding winged helix-turn-helix (wHTH) protein
MVGDHASVVLVGSRAEAIAVLLGGLPGVPDTLPEGLPEPLAGSTEPMFGVPEPRPAAGFDDFTVDSDLRIASWQDRSVPLSPLEHDLLCCLLAELGHTWPFEALHRQVWGNGHLGDRSDVQSVVKRLRRKLRDLGCPAEIHAVRGVGIRLVDRRRVGSPVVGS